MNLDSNDDDSDESDFLSIAGEDVDIHLNHYRVSKILNYGPYGLSNGDRQQNDGGGIRSRANLKQVKFSNEGKIMSLFELAAQKVACHFPFGFVEHYDQPVPEPMQCRIAFWSFPQDEEDVKLYTCLANGNADYFYRAEELIFQNAVRDMLQVGFHLSANVIFMDNETEHLVSFRVAVTFDRRRITSCSCTCMTSTFWCQHVVAVCLQRIRKPQEAKLRAPVSESLQRLEKNQLQKFAQYLINELPQQILPAAQKLLDELLSGDEAVINRNPAAPDPTAGALINEQTSWCLDYTHLSMDIHRILLKQCTAQPTVCSDIQSLHVTAPPATTEYSQLLRPIRGREPEGIWNLISIVGEMMKRRDPNLFRLLEIMTNEVMKFDKIMTWWLETKVSLHSGSTIHFANTKNSQCTSQYSCSNFCDEIVHLWRLAALDPSSSPQDRNQLYDKLFNWHLSIIKRHASHSENNGLNAVAANGVVNKTSKRNYLELFPGFKSAMEGCQVDWSDWDDKRGELVTVIGVDYNEDDKRVKHNKKRKRKPKSKANTTAAVANLETTDKLTTENVDDEQGKSWDSPPVDAASSSCIKEDEENNPPEGPTSEQPEREGINGVIAEVKPDSSVGQDEEAGARSEENLQNPLQELSRDENISQEREEERNNHIEPELRIYFMDGQSDNQQEPPRPETFEDLVKLNERRLSDPLQTLYAKIEGLHAHGHLEEARRVARRLSCEILSQRNYPTFRQLFALPRRRKKKGSLDNQMSIVASETLAKIHFLCNLLMEDPENHGLIFKLVLFGIELKRYPAATKPLEVKLISQKQELISLLKNVTIRDKELGILKEKAELICSRSSENQPDVLAVLILGNFIFEALVLARNLNRTPSDVNLGFHTALSALGAKTTVSETDHPLLCEGIRRQRGELALSLILHYKDDQEKLDSILKQLLDQDLIEANRKQASAVVQVATPTAADQHVSLSPAAKPSVQVTNSNKKTQPALQDTNQPTEAAAHFMFELAKTVFDKAGGNSTTAHLFRPQLVAPNAARGIHRKLHMCTLRIALHALGLQNRTSNNWMQRTYNGRASFIHDQALEVGLPAIKFLSENWQGYLTPVEAASVADKAGCSNDAETKRIAAEMAKSCLKYANFLDSNAVSRILVQCKEQTIEMIEEACNEIEQIAENDNVCPDVLFVTARAWYDLYLKLNTHDRNHCNNGNLYQLNNLVSPAGVNQMAPDQQSINNDQGPVVDWLSNSTSPYQLTAQPAMVAQQFMAVPLSVAASTEQVSQPPSQAQAVVPVSSASSSAIPMDPTKLTPQQQQQIHPPMWDVYAGTGFMLTPETPTYTNIDYVRAAFRVGIKAMESMKLPLHLGSKHNPKKLDEILWLLTISKSLGRDCLYKFSRSVIKNITDPYTLHIIIIEMIGFFEQIRLPSDHIDRTNVLKPILDKCLDRCVKQVKDLLKHTSYDQRNCIESIFDVAQTLTEFTQTEATASCYWEILKFVEHKNDARRNNRRRMNIDTSQRLDWIKKWATVRRLKVCYCDECWPKNSSQRFRHVSLIRHSNNTNEAVYN